MKIVTKIVQFSAILAALALGIRTADAQNACNPGRIYDQIQSGFHTTIATRPNGTYTCWGEFAAPNGSTNNLTPLDITAANGYAYTGTPLFASLGSNSSNNVEMILMTTTGLYAWGTRGVVVQTAVTTGVAFQAINMPSGVTPANVKQMVASNKSLMLVTQTGEVWVSGTVAELHGGGPGLPTAATNYWRQVTTSAAGNPVLTGVNEIRVSPRAAFALTASGTWYTWGTSTYLGDGSAAAARDRATPMTVAFAGVPKMIAMTSDATNPSYFALNETNGKIYALGNNTYGQLGRNNTTAQTGWVIVQNPTNTGDLTDVIMISGNDQDGRGQDATMGAITSTEHLYLWGSNGGPGMGGGSAADGAQFNLPRSPNGFTFGTDVPLYVEVGGHTSAYLKECADRYCYIGHKINGSMGDNVSAGSFISTFDCANTPQALICGASSYDGGDVPVSYENSQAAAHYYRCPPGIFLGSLGPTSNNGNPGNVAAGADNTGSNGDGLEEDGITSLPTYTGTGSYSLSVNGVNTSGSAGYVYIWVDWNENGIFEATEYQTTTIASAAGTQTKVFNWTSLAPVVCGKKYVRVRITNDVFTDNGATAIDERSIGSSIGGEVEDYFVQATVPTSAGVDQHLVCNSQASCGTNMAGIGLGVWTPAPGNPGTVAITTPMANNTAISNFSAPGAYRMIWTSGTCIDTMVVTFNVKPDAVNDVVTTPESTPVVINLPGNDTDFDLNLNTGSVVLLTTPTHGTGVLNAITGQVTYTPGTGYNGTDSFIYRICDTGTPILCDTAVVNITVSAVNDPPVAVNDVNTTPEDTPVSGNAASNDSDPDGPGATYTVVTGPTHGGVVLNTNGTYTYTPNTNYNGTDVFTYQICDGGTPNLCANATVTVTITPVNDPPLVNGDNVITTEDTPANITVLTNDVDLDGSLNPNTITALTSPLHGTVSINGITGVVTYTPNPNYSGTDSFIYRACDTGTPLPSLCDTAVVNITITAANDAPVAVNDVNTTPEDTPVNGNVSTNDTDVDGPGATYTQVTGPTHGGVTLNTDGTYTYTPNANYTGTDVFTYQVCDGGTPNLCATASVTITVTPVNDPPIANGDVATTNEDVPVIIPVLGNDVDIDGGLAPNTVATVTGPAHGTVSINPLTGAVTYTPAANYSGTDSFIYQVCDNGTPLPSLCDTALVSITVTTVNDPPVAVNDVNGTPEETPVNGNVSTNDSDPDGPGATYTLVTGPTNGTLTLNPDGTYTYTPNGNFTGTDVFTYQVCDGGTPNLCATATATITVTPVNDPPVAVKDNASTPEDVPVTIPVLGNDSDIDGMLVPGSVATVTPPAHGTIGINALTGDVTYTPNPNYTGGDTFIYQVCDNGTPLPSLCDTAVVNIMVTPVNDAPVAVNDVNSTPEDVPVNGNVSSNDMDVDGPGATYTVVTTPGNGTVTVNTDGTYTYTPNTNYNGTDVFTYQVCDGGTPNLCDTATVAVTVTPVNDAPIVNADNTTTPEDTPVTIAVLTNDTDVDGAMDPNTITTLTAPANGTVSVNGVTGTVTYTPNPNFTGTDTFIYRACDNGSPLPALCDTAVVTVTVTPVNDPPVAVNDTNTTPEDTPVNGNVSTNDSDPDGPGSTYTLTTPPTNGNVTVNTDGTYIYTPNGNFTGTDVFTYQVCDGGTPNLCATGTATVTVTPVNDAPIANADNTTTGEDTPVTIPVLTNDTDVDGALVPNTVTVGTAPANGSVTINNITGTITYTPNANFTGTDTFIYQVCDNGTPLPALCDTAVVTVTVTAVNDAPVAVNDVNTTTEDTPVNGNVSPNDSDVDGPGATYTLATPPANGNVTVNTDGTYTYTPNTNYTGTDVFTYSLCDGGTPNQCDTASVTITVTPVNDAPVANGDNTNTNEDTPVVINVPANDTDVDGSLVPNTVTIPTPPAHGTVTVNTLTGEITYTPTPNYTGTDTFIYEICDNGTPLPALCDTAVVTVTVNAVNDAPVAVNDVNTTTEDTPVNGNVSPNDSDVDGPGATFTVVTTPSNGNVTVNTDGTYTYTPNTNFTGTDVFTYQICDGGTPNLCDTATVTVTVTAVNDAPIANADNANTNEETPVTIPVLGNDTDLDGTLVPGSVATVTTPANGSVSINALMGVITYTPNANFTGTDTFIYQVCDNGTPLPALCDTAVVTVTVNAVNDAPVAVNDVNSTTEDTPVNGNVSPNDTDVDGPGATFTVVTTPSNGNVTVNTDGTYTYTPNGNFTGTDVFTYQICDGGTPNLCDTASVTVTVTPVNDAPIANADNTTTGEDTPVSIPVLTNDTDVDGSLVPNTVTVGTPPANGTVTLNNITGIITYTPNPNFTGTDTFIYQVCDNGTPLPALCDTAVVTVTVNAVNDAPVAVNDVNTTTEDTPVNGNVSPNDTDVDGPGSTFTVVTTPANGNVTVNTDGTYTYTPNPDFTGTDVFTYQICDGGTPNRCDTASVTITVMPVNDPPIAVDDFDTTPEDVPVYTFVLGNDSDVEGSLVPNSVAIVTPPTHGTVSVNPASGVITYTPATDYDGTDSYSYIVCDNGTPLPALCDTAVVTITVTPVNDPVVVTITPVVTDEDTPSGTVCFPINDDPADDHTATICGATNGTATVSVNNATDQLCVTFTPNADYYGPGTICVTICDNGSPTLCDTITVPVTVLPVNDPPVANADNTTTPEDVPVLIPVLGNDSDIDGTLVPNSVAIGTQPTNGTVIVNAVTGSITYTPNVNFTGTDTFIYTVCDNGTPLPGLCDTAVVTVTVTPVNDAPVAVNDVNSTTEDTPVNGNVSPNDSDVDGPGATFTLATPPVNGNVTVNTDGTYTYTPNTNFTGTDVFTYSLCDGGTPNLCDTATVTITVTPVNDAPIANADNGSTNEDTPITVAVLTNDTDVDGILVPNTVTVGTQPANGTVTVNNITGTVTYTPNANFTGTDTFIYQVCDNGTPLPSQCDTAVVTITVNAINDAPVAVNDVNSTTEDTPVNGNVSPNDSDVDGPGATFAVVTGTTNGIITVNTDGTYTYTPNGNFTGTDVFTYSLCDGGTPNLCDTATVTITVTPVNDVPLVNADNATTNEDTPVTIAVLTNDTDVDGVLLPNTVATVTLPTNGTVSINALTGVVTYTPNPNFNGTDTFIYIACDNGTPLPARCDTAVVTIVVNPVNDAPVANPDVATTPEETPVVINVPGNDTDLDGNLDPTTVSVTSGPTNGTVTVDPATGTVTYTPNPNYNGPDVFTYGICDTGMPVLCDTITVTINVTPVNDPPVISLPDPNTPEDTPVTICSPITDPDVANTFTATLCGGPNHGTVTGPTVFNGQVCLTYTPTGNYNGLDSICVIVCDNFGGCDTSTTVITVTPVNDAPVANPDVTTTPEDTPVVINVPGNDTDVDGNLDPTTVSVTSGPTNGTVTVDPATGTVTYTPNPNYNGLDVFTYGICDTGMPVLCDTTTVTINVTPVNDPPVINLPDPNTPEETPVTICSPITDPDVANTFTATLCGGPSHGTVTGPTVFNGQVCLTYTPTGNYNGLDSICVIVCDNFGACDTSTTVITVMPVNDPPVAVDDTASTNTGTPVVINVPGNDTDVDGGIDPTTVTITTPPTQGTVTVDPATGTVTYTPNANACGTDSFVYQICDNGTPLPALCDQALVTISIHDTQSPAIAGCPGNITLTNDAGVCGAVATWTLPTITDNCAGATLVSSHNSGATFPIGVTTVTYRATDAAGNTDTCSFTVTVTDTEAPAFVNCPGDITVSNFFNTCYEQVYWPTVLATDNCGSNGLTITSNYTQGYVFPIGVTAVTYMVTDLAGNSTTCNFNVTVVDDQAPSLQGCPADITLNNTAGTCGAKAVWTAPIYFDNCPGSTLTSNHTSGETFAVGTTTVTYVVTDVAGHTDSCSFTVTVLDTEAPVVSNCPAAITVPNDAGMCGAVVNWTAPTATDNCSAVTTVSTHNPGDVFALGTTTVAYTFTDSVGNVSTCVFTVTVTDTEAPVITGCPANITLNATAACTAPATWTLPVATDNCPGVTFTSNHASGDVFPIGITTVTYTATDVAGHVATCNFTVTVVDTVAPVVANCPANITVSNNFNICGAAVLWTPPIFTDNCGAPTVTASHLPGMTFPIGTTTVTYTATDASGNSTVCTFTVTVNDTQLPQISICPSNIVLNVQPGLCQSSASWTVPSVFDNCPGATLVTTHNPGDMFPVGTTTVTYTATDAAGNVSNCIFTVTVNETEPPVITGCPANMTVFNDPGVCGAAVNWTAPTATDNCGGVTLVSNHNPGDLFPVGNTTVMYTATDSAGNISTCNFIVTVKDAEAPVISNCPANIAVNNTAGLCGATVTWTLPTAADNCTPTVWTTNHNPGENFPIGTTTVTYTATDQYGNASTCTFTVTVTDTEAPVLTNCPANVTVNAAFNTCGAPVMWTVPTATDNCAGTVLSTTHLPGTVFASGVTTVTYTATDASGNVTTCSFTVTVNDLQAPSIASCPIDVTLNSQPGICGSAYNWVLPTAFDNCPGVTLATTHAPGTVFPVGTTAVTYTATDASGNTATCSFNVTVLDAEAPVIAGCPANITVSNDPGVCDAAVTWTAPTATDNCAVISFTGNHAPGDVFPVGTTTVTYTATDAAGKSTVCTFTVTVNDTELPVITGCPANITQSNAPGVCETAVTWTAPTATDNCSTGFTFTSNHNPGDVFPVGTSTVTYMATDGAGNVDSCTFTVTVNDTELPVIAGCPANINSCTDTISWTAPTATDNCGILSFTGDFAPGDVFPVGTTTVTYTATDAAGNVSTCSFTVTVSKPQLTLVYTNVTCNGLNDGTATVIVSNAVGPYSFNWGIAGSDSLVTGLAPGSYGVTVTDAIGCMASDSVTITEPAVFSVVAETVSIATCGFSDGSAVIATTGGTKPYAYLWSDGQATESLYNVADGVFSLVATDANGCQDSLSVTVTCEFGKVPQLLTPNGDGHNDVWFIPGIDNYPDAVVEVYNRWGNLVYKAAPYMNDWAGISSGMLNTGKNRLPAGTYFYVITLHNGDKAMTGYLELQY